MSVRGWEWDYRVIQDLQTMPAWVLDPWSRAASSAYGEDTTPFLGGTVLWLVASLALLGLGGLDYVVRRSWITAATVVLLIPGSVAAVNAMLAYGMVGQSLIIDGVWLATLVLFVRHRVRNRNRPRTERG